MYSTQAPNKIHLRLLTLIANEYIPYMEGEANNFDNAILLAREIGLNGMGAESHKKVLDRLEE